MTENAKAETIHPARFVRNDNVSPEELVREAANVLGTEVSGSGVFVLAHTPRAARFLKLRNGTLCDERGGAWPEISQAYELRLFCEEAEISWRRDGVAGRAVLTRDDGRPMPGGWVERTPDGFGKLADGERLLWGEVDERTKELAPGWWRLSSPRVGSIYVPLQPAGGDKPRQAVLKVVEYARVADDGNVVPCGERLKGFDWR